MGNFFLGRDQVTLSSKSKSGPQITQISQIIRHGFYRRVCRQGRLQQNRWTVQPN